MKQQNGGKVKKQHGGNGVKQNGGNGVPSLGSMKHGVPKNVSSLVLLHTTPMKIDKAMSLGDVKI